MSGQTLNNVQTTYTSKQNIQNIQQHIMQSNSCWRVPYQHLVLNAETQASYIMPIQHILAPDIIKAEILHQLQAPAPPNMSMLPDCARPKDLGHAFTLGQ